MNINSQKWTFKDCLHLKGVHTENNNSNKKNRTNEKPTGKRLRVKEDVKTSSLKKKKKKGKIKGAHLIRKIRKKTFKTRKLQKRQPSKPENYK